MHAISQHHGVFRSYRWVHTLLVFRSLVKGNTLIRFSLISSIPPIQFPPPPSSQCVCRASVHCVYFWLPQTSLIRVAVQLQTTAAGRAVRSSRGGATCFLSSTSCRKGFPAPSKVQRPASGTLCMACSPGRLGRTWAHSDTWQFSGIWTPSAIPTNGHRR